MTEEQIHKDFETMREAIQSDKPRLGDAAVIRQLTNAVVNLQRIADALVGIEINTRPDRNK